MKLFICMASKLCIVFISVFFMHPIIQFDGDDPSINKLMFFHSNTAGLPVDEAIFANSDT